MNQLDRTLWRLTLKLWSLAGEDPGKLAQAIELLDQAGQIQAQLDEVFERLESLIDSL